MHRDELIQILQDLDVVEARMRGLEARLTSIRDRIHRHLGGDRSGVLMNGRKPERNEPVSPECPF